MITLNNKINVMVAIIGENIEAKYAWIHLNRQNFDSQIIMMSETVEKDIGTTIKNGETYYLRGNLSIDSNLNITLKTKKYKININPQTILITETKYLKTVLNNKVKKLVINHILQISNIDKRLFISPTISVKNLPSYFRRKTGELVGHLMTKYLTGNYYKEEIQLVCKDKNVTIIPNCSSRKDKIYLWYFSKYPVEKLDINDIELKAKGTFGIITFNPNILMTRE